MVSLNSNATSQDAYLGIKQQRQELQLRILLNNLAADYKSAGTKPQQESIKSQIDNLISSMGEGKSFSDVTGQDSSIFGKNNGMTAQQIAGQALGGKAAGGAAAQSQKGSEEDKAIISDLEKEFADQLGVKNTEAGDTKDWAEAAAKSDKVNFYDPKTGEALDGKKDTVQNSILEFESEKYGKVKIQVGGDGELNGKDDKVIEMGGKAAAQSMEGGLKDTAGLKKEVETPKTAEAKAVTKAPEVAQLAETNPVLGKMVDQVEDPANLSESNIKDLIAAIMLLINQKAA